jgi:predicted Zn-dependent protease
MKRFVSLVALVVVMSVFASVANADSDSWKRAILNGALTAIVNRPTAKNVALAGDDMALKVRSEYRTNSDPMLDAVVSSIAQAKKMADVPKILVVDQRDEASKAVLNAFCVPGTQGGHIFVTEGLIEFFKSKDPLGWQDDVAGVVGHECGHIQNGDSKKAWSDALASNVLLSTILGGTEANQTIQVAAGVLSMVRSAKYSRTQELQADQFGLESLAVTGRDPKAMARSLKLLSESEGEISKLGEIAADHPRFVDRIGHLDKRLTENPPEINLPAPPTVSIGPTETRNSRSQVGACHQSDGRKRVHRRSSRAGWLDQ